MTEYDMDHESDNTQAGGASVNGDFYPDLLTGATSLAGAPDDTQWVMYRGIKPERLGLLPMFFSIADDTPMQEQLNRSYQHGGGYMPFNGFQLLNADKPVAEWRLVYPGDPAFRPLAACLGDHEMMVVFDYAWVMVYRADGTWVIARMD